MALALTLTQMPSGAIDWFNPTTVLAIKQHILGGYSVFSKCMCCVATKEES